jgi:hypothetical protein
MERITNESAVIAKNELLTLLKAQNNASNPHLGDAGIYYVEANQRNVYPAIHVITELP